MHHLLLGLPVRQLGRAPFVATLREALDLKARDLGLSVAPGAYVHLAANIGGFVGGDHVTALIATEPHWTASTTSLVMDIGTNTEISLIHRGEILTASCPSGPALEGGHISCGMRAAEGAIERVSYDGDALKIGVIGKHRPVGLCGSGVLDCIAALRAGNLLDARGRLTGPHPAIVEDEGLRAVTLAPNVHFTQRDVRAVQLAKSAIQTGIELLLGEAQLAARDIERVIIAGAFGAYIDVASAHRGRPAAGAAARSLRAGRQRGRRRRAPDSHLAKDADAGARARATLPLCRAEHAQRFPEGLPRQYRFQGTPGAESIVTDANGFNLIVIGDRINPGFKPTRVLVDNHDIAGIQALAVRQVESGASYLDVTIGPLGVTNHDYLAETVARHPASSDGAALPRLSRCQAAGSVSEGLRPRPRQWRAALDQFHHRASLGDHGSL